MKTVKTLLVRQILVLILTTALVLNISIPAFAGWATYNGTTYNAGNVYLEEKWFGSQQVIHYYSNGELARTAAGQGNTFWIGAWPVLDNLYDTCYWGYDKGGNIFAIDKAQQLLFNVAGTTTFIVNTSVSGCVGFQRDEGKFVYLVYTSSGAYSLEELLRNNNYNNNFNNGNNCNNCNNYTYKEKSYPYVTFDDSTNTYTYHISSSVSHKYRWTNTGVYYRGTNSNIKNIKMETSVEEVTFDTDKGYILFTNDEGEICAYKIGKTSETYKKYVGEDFYYFDEYNYVSEGYVDTDGVYNEFEYEEFVRFPRIRVQGNYIYYDISEDEYHKYHLSNKNLSYRGNEEDSVNVKLASSVKKIIFSDEGYIVYANTSDDVYAYKIGKTSTSYRVYIGEDFDYFKDDDNNYISDDDGYIDDYDDFIEFDF